ncbi:MAG: hypothetical protein V4590_03495 [Bacteroidota bacterium]
MIKNIISAWMLCFLFACDSGKQQNIEYFDTKSFFEATITRLSAHGNLLHKELMFGDSTVTQQPSTVNWANELQPFVEIDLHKNAYKARFKADTSKQANTYQVTYTPLDTQTDLKNLVVTIDNSTDAISSIHARFSEQNTLYEATKELVFYNDSLFTISGSQQVKLGKNISYSITGTITGGQ